ncbi:MAG TPA: ABC transporter ATP-binding protein [Candidatus Nanopelagicaceae bacterium]|nr:ABC transporter ATP-binding protein [Candidatus Nanopelagicaceae bacterium]
MRVIELADVDVIRDGKLILSGLNWSVEDDQRWVVLGPNGAGKTTLMQILSGNLFPSNGEVTLLGARLGTVDIFELRPRIGVCSAALAERFPADELVADVVLTAAWGYVGRWRERYDLWDRSRALALLRALGVDHLADRTFGTLSEGERKRVQIARALMPDPELLLLDEPAAGLDLGGREDLVGRLGKLTQDPLAPVSILITHHVEEIPPGITHALVLKDGLMAGSGPIDQVLTSRVLSAAFGLPISVEHRNLRWFARLDA